MRTHILLALGLFAVIPPTAALAGRRGLMDTTRSPDARVYMTNLSDVTWTTGFWAGRFKVCRTAMVPHLWSIFSNDRESHAWANFLIAAGLRHKPGDKFEGPPFNDGDFLKWVEALSQVYAVTRDPAVGAQLDRIIAVLGKAQRADGYFDTQMTIAERQGDRAVLPFSEREHFETYNMGHLMTAACVHYRATGKTTLLALAVKAANYLDRLSLRAPEELARTAICPTHYMGVVELYRATGNPRYLALARRLIAIRSLVSPAEGSDQNQDRVPLLEATEVVGHATRANYLYAGLADLTLETGNPANLHTLTVLSNDVADRKLYVTGATGALYDGASPDGSADFAAIRSVHQAYGRAYQLPNLSAYNEGCATVAYALWNWRMFVLTGDAHYVDLFEQSLYNGVLSGVSLDGLRYFYTNPLRRLRSYPVALRWPRTRQPNIPESFCCPPNIVRTVAEASDYFYALSPGALWVNLYGSNQLDTAWTDGGRIRLREDTDYPWSGAVKLTIQEAPARPIAIRLRIPGWMHPGAASLRVDGRPFAGALTPGTYAQVVGTWKPGDVIELSLPFAGELWEANPLVEDTLNQAVVRRGPLVYCLESADLPAGVRLEDVALGLDARHRVFTAKREKIAGASLVTLSVPGFALEEPAWKSDQLYREVGPPAVRDITVKLVPYFAWDNRGDGDMTVWIPVR